MTNISFELLSILPMLVGLSISSSAHYTSQSPPQTLSINSWTLGTGLIASESPGQPEETITLSHSMGIIIRQITRGKGLLGIDKNIQCFLPVTTFLKSWIDNGRVLFWPFRILACSIFLLRFPWGHSQNSQSSLWHWGNVWSSGNVFPHTWKTSIGMSPRQVAISVWQCSPQSHSTRPVFWCRDGMFHVWVGIYYEHQQANQWEWLSSWWWSDWRGCNWERSRLGRKYIVK